jgi:elongation factor Ts
MVTAQDVQKLRQATGAGMMDAKRALTEADGDFDKAKQMLVEQGLADARKRSGRSQSEVTIGQYIHIQAERPVLGILVELASETDFVAKSDEFQAAANDIAMHIAAARPRWVRRDEVPADAIEMEKKVIEAQARNEGKKDEVIPKIVEGKIGSFYADYVLYDQPFINPEKFEDTVGELVDQLSAKMGENIGVRRFARIGVGEEEA